MKATGIVRRIDDLGRVVIPKEIRRTLRIREGDPLEIFTDREGEVILKKYSPIGELAPFVKQYADSLSHTTGDLVCITDTERVIAAAGTGKKEFHDKLLSRQLQTTLEGRMTVVARAGEKSYMKVTMDQEAVFAGMAVAPIVAEGDLMGAVLLLWREGQEKPKETEEALARTAAAFLGRQMEQ